MAYCWLYLHDSTKEDLLVIYKMLADMSEDHRPLTDTGGKRDGYVKNAALEGKLMALSDKLKAIFVASIEAHQAQAKASERTARTRRYMERDFRGCGPRPLAPWRGSWKVTILIAGAVELDVG